MKKKLKCYGNTIDEMDEFYFNILLEKLQKHVALAKHMKRGWGLDEKEIKIKHKDGRHE